MKRMKRMKRVRRMKRMKRMLWLLATAVFLFMAGQGTARCGEIDQLVDKLVEKDVLNPNEAKLLLSDTKADVAMQNAQGKNSALPTWVQTMKFKGDLRLRYQQEELDATTGSTTTTTKRERGRVRLRMGVDATVTKGWDVGFGISSGAPVSSTVIDRDARSTNQTMENNFTGKPLYIDYMYARWSAASNVAVLGGKMKLADTMWLVDDLLWDSDINPEGVSIAATWQVWGEGIELFLNTGYFVIDEISGGAGNADPSLLYIQPGAVVEINDALKLKAAVNLNYFNSVEGLLYSQINKGGGTNTTSAGRFVYDYDSWGITTELGYALNDESSAPVKYYALFGDYISNSDPADQNTGYLFGGKFGSKKVSDKGTWQFKAQYRQLEKDAWVDFLPDSDVIEGITDVKGTELIFDYAIAKNVTLGVDYYMSETMKATTKKEQNVLQIDCNLKF